SFMSLGVRTRAALWLFSHQDSAGALQPGVWRWALLGALRLGQFAMGVERMHRLPPHWKAAPEEVRQPLQERLEAALAGTPIANQARWAVYACTPGPLSLLATLLTQLEARQLALDQTRQSMGRLHKQIMLQGGWMSPRTTSDLTKRVQSEVDGCRGEVEQA